MSSNQPGNPSDDQKKKGGPPNISDIILGALRPRAGKETTKWLTNLTEDAVKDAAEAAAKEQTKAASPEIKKEGKKQNTMVGWMDQIFDCFQQYEFEFNRAVAGSELTVNHERPTVISEVVRASTFAPSETVQFFKGRLSTRLWTLVIRGQNERIEGFILPIDKLIAFSADHSGFTRFLLMEAGWQNGEMFWNVGGVPVHWEEVRAFAKELFGSLVKVAKGMASNDEVFSLRPGAPSERSSQMASVQPAPAFSSSSPDTAPFLQADSSFNQHNPMFQADQTPPAPSAAVTQPREQATLGPSGLPTPAAGSQQIKQAPVLFPDPRQSQGKLAGLGSREDATTAAPAPASLAAGERAGAAQAQSPAMPQVSEPREPVRQPTPVIQQPQAPALQQPAPALQQPQAPAFQQPAPVMQQPPAPALQQPTPVIHQPPAPVMQQPAAPAFQQPAPVIQQPLAPALQQPAAAPCQQAPWNETKPMGENREMSLADGCDLMSRLIDREIELLALSGAEAFAAQDMARVEKTMRRTTKIKSLREQMQAVLLEWKTALRED